MATLTVQSIPNQGALENLAFSATALTGDDFLNDGDTLLILRNDNAGQQTVVVDGGLDPEYGEQITETITMETTEYAIMGPFKSGWNQAGSKVTFTSSAVDVMAAVVRFSPRR